MAEPTDDQRKFADQWRQSQHAANIRAQRSQQEEAAQNQARGEPSWFESRVQQILDRSLHFAINPPHGIAGGAGSYAFNIKETGAGGAQEFPKPPNQPFQVLYIGDVTGAPRIGVNYYSPLFTSLSVTSVATISGLLSSSPAPSDSGGFAVPSIGQKIWLRIKLTSGGAFDAAAIQHGASWAGYPDPNEFDASDPDNPFQRYYYQIIAEVVAGSDPRPGIGFTISAQVRKVVQLLSHNLILTQWDVDGSICNVPEHFNGLAT